MVGELKVPLNTTPVGRPLVPLPLRLNEPPAAKVAPAARLPVIREPVVKLTAPRLPVTGPPNRPVTAVRVEAFRVNSEPLLVIWPPLLLKLVLLAHAAMGRANMMSKMRIDMADFVIDIEPHSEGTVRRTPFLELSSCSILCLSEIQSIPPCLYFTLWIQVPSPIPKTSRQDATWTTD